MKLRAYAPAVLWGAFVLFLGGRSDVPTVDTDLPLDKAAHFVLYSVLGLLTARGWLQSGRRPSWVLAVLAALSIGVADELHQRSVANRSPEVMDFVADTIGVIVGFAWIARRSLGKRSQSA